MSVLDVSNYDWPLPALCLAERGVERVIVGCQRPHFSTQQVGLLRAANIEVSDLYTFLYFGFDPASETQKALDVARLQGGIRTIWLDCESTGQHDRAINAEQRISELHTCVNMVQDAGYRCGIYTGGWWWPMPFGMGNSTEFAHLPLWHSAYFDDGREVRKVAYGGWTDVAIHQYSSSIVVCGRERDHNHVFEQEEDEVAKEDYENLLLAVFAAGEETMPNPDDPNGEPILKPRDERLALAKYRMSELAVGNGQSVNDKAASAMAVAQDDTLAVSVTANLGALATRIEALEARA